MSTPNPTENPFRRFFKHPPSAETDIEKAKLLFTEELLELMEKQDVSRSELARRLGVAPARVTSLMTGANNFTMETMVKIARALDAGIQVHLAPKDCDTRWAVFDRSTVHKAFRMQPPVPAPPATAFVLYEVAQNDRVKAA